MNDRQRRENERNIRSAHLLNENIRDFLPNVVAKLKIAALNRQMALIEASIQKPFSGNAFRYDYTIVEDAFDALFDELRGMRDFARSMERDIRGLENKFRLPTGSDKRKYIDAARVFIKDAEEFKELFMDYGIDKDFMEGLETKADALEQAANDVDDALRDQTGVITTFEQQFAEANNLIKSLDPIVRWTYRANPVKRAAWIYVSHVERRTPEPTRPKTEKR